MTALQALLFAADSDIALLVERECRARGYALERRAPAGASWPALAAAATDLVIVDLAPGAEPASALLDALGASPVDSVRHVLAILPPDVEQSGGASGDAALRWSSLDVDDVLRPPFDAADVRLRLTLAEKRLAERAASRRREAQLLESFELLALAASGTNDGFWHCSADPSGDYFKPELPVWYSTQLTDLLGFEQDEFAPVLGSWSQRLHPADCERVFQALTDHLERRVPYDIEYRLQCKSGAYRWFNARGQACWDSSGRPLRMAGSIRDVTERRAAEALVRENEARYRLISESANDIIWTIAIPDDLQLGASPQSIAAGVTRVSITHMSPAVERVLGYSPEEAQTLTLGQLLAPSAYQIVLQEFLEEFRRPASDPPPRELRALELEHVAKSGEIRCCDVTCVVQREPNGRPTNVLGVSRDITERRRAQQSLRKEQAFLRQLVDVHERERSVFAYEIHDGIMPRITASIMHLESSCAGSSLNGHEWGEFQQGLNLLEVAIAEGRRLISGLRPPILDEAGIVAAIEYLVNEHLPRIPGLTFTHNTRFDRLAPPLENALFRVVQEGLCNVGRHSQSKSASVELWQADDALRVVVSDRGVGFDPQLVDERHFGLQGIRKRARLLAGQAWIESAPGQGTVVRVDFPLLLSTGENTDPTAADIDAEIPKVSPDAVAQGAGGRER